MKNDRVTTGLAKIDRPGNSRYYFMLRPLSGVLHGKRKARKRVVVHMRLVRSLPLFCIWTALSILVGLLDITLCLAGSATRCDLSSLSSAEIKMIDVNGDCVTRSRQCVVVNCEMRMHGVVREQGSSSSTISMDLDSH